MLHTVDDSDTLEKVDQGEGICLHGLGNVCVCVHADILDLFSLHLVKSLVWPYEEFSVSCLKVWPLSELAPTGTDFQIPKIV